MVAGRGDITFAIALRGTCEHADDRPDRCARSHGSSCSRYPSLPSAPSPFPIPSSAPGNPVETSTAERRFLSGRHPDAHGCRQAQRPPTMTFLCRNPRRTPPLLVLPVPLISSHLRNSCSPALIDNALAVTTTPLRFSIRGRFNRREGQTWSWLGVSRLGCLARRRPRGARVLLLHALHPLLA